MLNLPPNPQFCQTDVSGSTFVNADCFDVFPFIEDKSIDAIICDLPYGITACKWDSILPLDKLWNEYKRVIKDNCPIVLFAQTPFDKVLGCSNLEWLKYEWIWEKSKASNFLQAKYMPMRVHENILIFCNGKANYFPQKTEGKSYRTRKMNEKHGNPDAYNNIPNYMNREPIEMNGRLPRTVQYFKTAHTEGKLHPTLKPLELMEYLVKTYTNEGDMVLDNTMGSGTTNLACIKLNRKSIGIEKEKQYYDVAVRRASEYCG